jgi:hypothetical protein
VLASLQSAEHAYAADGAQGAPRLIRGVRRIFGTLAE